MITEGSVVAGFCDNGGWRACFGLSLRDMCLRDAATSRRMVRPGGRELRQVCGSGRIADGRNNLARDFLATDGEWLWLVDTDMGFGPGTVDALVASADPLVRPVMGALCFSTHRVARAEFYAERSRIVPTVYEHVDGGEEAGFVPVLDYKRSEVIAVDGTGAACLLIHRSALERVRAELGDAWFDCIVHPTGDRGRPRTFSEDLSFCLRLAGLGVPVHVDTSVRTVHDKGGIFLDEATFDAQMGRGAADGAG